MKTKNKFKIEKMFAFVYLDDDNVEKIVIGDMLFGKKLLITTNEWEIASFMPKVELISKQTGLKLKLVEFSTRREIETIG